MKRVVSFLSILFLLGVLAWPLVQQQVSMLKSQGTLDFKTVKVVKTDSKGSMYLVVDRGSQEELIKTDKYGEILKKSGISPAEPSYRTLISDIYVDADENMYVLYTEFESAAAGDCYAVMVRFDSGWYNKKLILRKKIGSSREMENFTFSGMSDDKVNIFGGWSVQNKVVVFQLPLGNDTEVTTIYEYNLQNIPRLRELLVLPAGKIAFVNIQGQLFLGDTDGKVNRLYPREGQEAIAEGICYGGENSIYFYDAYQGKYMRTSLIREAQVVIDGNAVLNSEQGIMLSNLKNISATPDGRLAAVVAGPKGYELANGGLSYVSLISGVRDRNSSKPLIYIIEILIVTVLLSVLIWDFYCKIMKMQMSIILKQCIGLLSAVLVIMTFVNTIVSENLVRKFLDDEYKSQLVNLGFMLISEIGRQDLNQLKNPSDTGNALYVRLKESADREELRASKELQPLARDMYFNIFRKEKERTAFVFSTDYTPVAFPVDYVSVDTGRKEWIDGVFETKNTVFGNVTNSSGSWMYMGLPLTVGNQNYGILEIGVSTADYTLRYNMLKKLFSTAVLMIAGVLLVVILSTILTTMLSIRKLNKGVEQIGAGHFDVRVNVRSGDEIEQLSRKFNDMASYIQNYTRKLAELNKSYYRFIPEKFITLLGEKSIENVRKGDHVKEDMAVLHMNVRSFFALTANMESEDIFNFINGVFERFSPIIQSFNGIIDRFMDTGFTAVFLDYPENAVNAALRIQEKLSAWNMERAKSGRSKVNIGIVVHFGPVMLGVIGDGVRLSSAAVSQCLHTAARLEEYGNLSNVAILATGNLVKNLPPDIFKKRYIGLVRVGEADMDIYDFYEGDEFSMRERKDNTLESFKNGVQCYRNGDYFRARTYFIEVLRALPEDGVGRRYLQLADAYYHNKDASSRYYSF